jgi:hypothetical protein
MHRLRHPGVVFQSVEPYEIGSTPQKSLTEKRGRPQAENASSKEDRSATSDAGALRGRRILDALMEHEKSVLT